MTDYTVEAKNNSARGAKKEEEKNKKKNARGGLQNSLALLWLQMGDGFGNGRDVLYSPSENREKERHNTGEKGGSFQGKN